MASSNQCCVCFDNIPKQTVNLVFCEHNCFCANCALQYFKNANTCPICRKQIDGTFLINDESEYVTKIYSLLFSPVTQSPIQNRNHGAQINVESQNDVDNPKEKADEPQINVEENNGDNSEQNEEEKKDQNLDEIGNLFRQDVDTNSNRNLGEINNLFEQNIGANSNSNLNEINNLLDANLDKIDVKFEQDEKLTNGAEKQEQNLDAIDKKERVSLNWILYDTTNHNKKNEEEEKEEEQKLYSRTISKTISIASSEEERTPTPAWRSSQIDNVGNRNKPGFFFSAPPDMSGSPAKLPPSRLLLSLRTEQMEPKQFAMVISSRKRSSRKSLSVERKVELEAIKEEISDDSELDLIIENENPMKKRKLN